MPQYVIIAYDGTDAGALERRMKARTDHVSTIDALRKEGKVLMGIALTDGAGKMIGSVCVGNFASRTELDAWLAREPYVVQKVWDKIEILTGNLGPSFSDLLKAPDA